MSAVSLQNVTKSFDRTTVIPSLNFEIAQGEFVVLVGPSGCGKSTTLRMIAGLENVTRGRILINGRDVTWKPPKMRDIAMVFQSYALYPHMTVAGNMSFALRLAGFRKAEIKKRVVQAADMLQLGAYLDRLPRDLSGGQRQRVAMGRSIVRDAYCFLFDEPLSNLDAQLRALMRTELAILHKKLDRTMIYVTHDQIEAMTMADRIVIMKDGVIQQIGSPKDVYNAPVNTFVATFIGSPGMTLLNGHLVEESGNLHCVGDGFSLPLPPRVADRTRNGKDRSVSLGLRPEHFACDNHGNGFAPIDLTIDVAEYIGSSQYLAARIGATPVVAAVAIDPESEKLASGTYFFDTSRLYLFDRRTGEAL